MRYGQGRQFLRVERVNADVARLTNYFRSADHEESKRHFIDVIFNNVRTVPAHQIAPDQVKLFDSLFSMMVREYEAPWTIVGQALLHHLLYASL